jgi:hypothetical protein
MFSFGNFTEIDFRDNFDVTYELSKIVKQRRPMLLFHLFPSSKSSFLYLIDMS